MKVGFLENIARSSAKRYYESNHASTSFLRKTIWGLSLVPGSPKSVDTGEKVPKNPDRWFLGVFFGVLHDSNPDMNKRSSDSSHFQVGQTTCWFDSIEVLRCSASIKEENHGKHVDMVMYRSKYPIKKYP